MFFGSYHPHGHDSSLIWHVEKIHPNRCFQGNFDTPWDAKAQLIDVQQYRGGRKHNGRRMEAAVGTFACCALLVWMVQEET